MARLEGSGRAKALSCTGAASESRAGFLLRAWLLESACCFERLQLLVGASSAWNLVDLAPWSQVHDSCKSAGICVMNLGEIHRLLSSTLDSS